MISLRISFKVLYVFLCLPLFSSLSSSSVSEKKRERDEELTPVAVCLKRTKGQKLTASMVADYLLHLDATNSAPESEYFKIDHLKLQKLLYYINGYSLAVYDESLFDDDILHWTYGPVVREVYDRFSGDRETLKAYEQQVEINVEDYHSWQISLISSVYKQKLMKTGRRLIDDTHAEMPYKKTFQNQVISQLLIKKQFDKWEVMLPYLLNQIIEAQSNDDINDYLLYLRKYISYNVFDYPTLEDMESSFSRVEKEISATLEKYWKDGSKAQWSQDTLYQVFLGMLFFPVQFEYLYESTAALITIEKFHYMLLFSAKYGNLLSLYHCLTIVKIYSIDEKMSSDEFDESDEEITLSYLKNDALRSTVEAYLSGDQLSKPFAPMYFAGLLCLADNKAGLAKKYFEKGWQNGDQLCTYRYGLALKSHQREEIAVTLDSLDEGLAKMLRASAIKEIKDKISVYASAGELGVSKGYEKAAILSGSMRDKKREYEYYSLAVKNHFLGCIERIIELKIEDKKFDEAKDLCIKWGDAGDSRGYIKYSELLNEDLLTPEDDCLAKAGLRGLEKRVQLAETSEKRDMLVKQLCEYRKSMVALLNF